MVRRSSLVAGLLLTAAPALASEPVATEDEADVVLSLDWVDLAGGLKQAYGIEPVGAKVVQVSVDAHLHRGWSMDHQALPPVDFYLQCEPDAAVPERDFHSTSKPEAVTL